MNYDEIKKALREMKPRGRLYELVKAEMIRRDRWRQKKRGTAFKKGHDPNRVILKPEKRDSL